MKPNLLALAALSFVTACIDTPAPGASSTEVLTLDPIAQADAAALCDADLHLPTRAELTELLGDCVETSYGWQCTPCGVGNCAERFAGDDVVSQGHIWSSTACALSDDAHGIYLADLGLGQLVCAHAEEPVALPLCVR